MPHTVREFVEQAFAEIGVTIAWRGSGDQEQGFDTATDTLRVAIDRRYFRPTEVTALWGNPAKAREKLNWKHTTSFEQLVHQMVDADRKHLARERSDTAGTSR